MSNINKIKSLTNTLVRVEENLKDENKILKFLLKNTLDGYWDLDLVKDYIYLSGRFRRQLGYTSKELTNDPQSWLSICDDYSSDLFNESISKLSKDNNNFKIDLRLQHKKYGELLVQCVGMVVNFDDNGKPLRVVGIHRIK